MTSDTEYLARKEEKLFTIGKIITLLAMDAGNGSGYS